MLGLKTVPRREQDPLKLKQNGPQHPSKATKTAKSLKNLKHDPQKSMGYPSRPRFWSLHGCIWNNFCEDFDPFLHLDFGSFLCTFFKILETLLD